MSPVVSLRMHEHWVGTVGTRQFHAVAMHPRVHSVSRRLRGGEGPPGAGRRGPEPIRSSTGARFLARCALVQPEPPSRPGAVLARPAAPGPAPRPEQSPGPNELPRPRGLAPWCASHPGCRGQGQPSWPPTEPRPSQKHAFRWLKWGVPQRHDGWLLLQRDGPGLGGGGRRRWDRRSGASEPPSAGRSIVRLRGRGTVHLDRTITAAWASGGSRRGCTSAVNLATPA